MTTIYFVLSKAIFSEEPRESRGEMWQKNCFLMIKKEESENHWRGNRA